jgi:hypothetical protein
LNSGIARINEDGSLDASFGYRVGRRLTAADIGGGVNVQWHQGGILVSAHFEGEVNGSPRALGRVILDGAPNHGFGFGNQSGVIWAGPGLSANETDEVARITVRRLGDVTAAATIHYATSAGSARAGVNYVAVSGILTFAPLEIEQTIDVPLIQDTVFKGQPDFFVALSEPSIPAALDRPTRVTIRDREFGLVPGLLLSRLDGSREFQFNLTGVYQAHTIEGSLDFTNWCEASVSRLGGCFICGPPRSPPFISIPAGGNHHYYRARRDQVQWSR